MNSKQEYQPEFKGLTQYFVDHIRDRENLDVYTFLSQGEKKSINFLALANRADSTVAVLQTYCEVGDRAVLIFKPGLEFIISFLACLLSGVVAVPLYPAGKNKTKQETLYHVIGDCQPTCILTSEGLSEAIKSLDMPVAAQPTVVVVDTNADTLSTHTVKPVYYCPQPEDLAFLQYTSGSTGNPKGVRVTHQNLLVNQQQLQKVSGHDRASIGVSWLPPYHDMGLIGGILQPLYVGFPVILMAPVTFITKPLSWLQAISDYRATTSCAPNFAFDLCVKRIGKEQAANLDLSQLAVLFNGAEAVAPATINAFSEHFKETGFNKHAFLPCYGMAEATLIVTGRRGIESVHVDSRALADNRIDCCEHSAQSTQLISCGYPVDEVDIAIVDSNTGARAPARQINEVWLSGPSLATAYWNNPKLSKETFAATLAGDKREWLKTGDLGFIADGQLYLSGRKKELIIIRGRNYYPQDIETLVFQHFEVVKVNGVAAFSVTSSQSAGGGISTRGEQLALVCELERSALGKINYQTLCENITLLIVQKFEIQAYSITLIKPAAMPKTTSGKVRRFECRYQLQDGGLREVYQWNNLTFLASKKHTDKSTKLPAQTADQQSELINWMQSYLETASSSPEPADSHRHFEHFGMDSLQSASFIGDLSEYIGCDINIDILNEYQTIAELSRYLSSLCTIQRGLAQLDGQEKQKVLKILEKSTEKKPIFNLADIPKAFYCFAEYPPNKALIARNTLLGQMGVNPFFSVVNGINDNYISRIDGNYINYSSNNFLGLSNCLEVQREAQAKIKELGTSVSASRLVSGEKNIHKELESRIATFIGVEDALVFVGAATANVSTIGHLLNKNDLILYDELSHESLTQGAQLSQATARPFKHNDFNNLESLLQKLRGRYEKVLIFIEGLYSMDGDTPELKEFIRIKNNYKCWLMVDECLSIGVLGKSGRGIAEQQSINPWDVEIWMGGLSKAFASCGGYIAGSGELINYLKYTCPGFVFTTGISPANAAAASKAIALINDDHKRVTTLHKNAQLFLNLAQQRGFNTGVCQGFSIVPIIVGDSQRGIEIYKCLLDDGIHVQPILYPAVAEGSARFRFSLTALHTEEQIRSTIDCLGKHLQHSNNPNKIRSKEYASA